MHLWSKITKAPPIKTIDFSGKGSKVIDFVIENKLAILDYVSKDSLDEIDFRNLQKKFKFSNFLFKRDFK